MAATSRSQINFERLLNVCEKQLASEQADRWRLQKFVEDLQQRLVQLTKESCNKAHPEVIKDYQKRVEVLRGILNAERQESSSSKLKAASSIPVPKLHSLPKSISSDGASAQSKEILLHAKAKFSNQSRKALLGESGDGLRQRGGVASSGAATESDLDAVLQHHEQMQEKLAEDMVQLARNMKDHAKTASRIVQDDNKKLQESNKMADVNQEQLKVESTRLEEHTKKSSWWMFLLILFIVIVFICMVIFMRLFPKPKT